MIILKAGKGNVFCFVVMIVALLFCFSSQARADLEGDYVFYVINGEAQITQYQGAGGDVIIPNTLGGVLVSRIGGNTFASCQSLTSVYIPKGVTNIDDGRIFPGCTALMNIIVDADNMNFASIDGVLYNKAGTVLIECPQGLTSLSIPEGVASIGDHAFEGDINLTNVNIPEGVISIGDYSFSGCTGLTNIIIPQGVTSIGYGAFQSCTGLTSISIPEGVTSIGDYAFAEDHYLTSINLPQGLTAINEGTFWGCSGLNSISIPEGVTSIGLAAFSGCTGLTSTNIPESVISIDKWAFQYCTALSSVSIPESVTSIGELAFQGCTGLSNINIPDLVTSISPGTFMGCTSLTDITIPLGITSINYEAFQGCTGLASFTIPDGITSIERSVFQGCTGLTSINIPESITSIDYFAFQGCTGLTSIIIPDSVTSISPRVFEYCTGLTDINIPEGVTTIAPGSYDGCTGLKNIIIPQWITSIGSHAFTGCTGLTSVSIPEGVTDMGDGTFMGCTNLISIDIPEGVTSISQNVFDGCTSLINVNIPESVTSIGLYAFYRCPGLTSIILPETLTSIGAEAFGECTGLISINIPQAVNSISELPFYGCKRLTTITVADTNQNYADINGLLFDKTGNVLLICPEGVTSISLPTSLTRIGDYAFNNCNGLTDIILPDSLVRIGNYAFYGCGSLTSIVIPQWVESIGWLTFYGTNFTSITFNSATIVINDSIKIPYRTKIIGYDPSTAKDYADRFGRVFEVIGKATNSFSILNNSLKQSTLIAFMNEYDMSKTDDKYIICQGAKVEVGGISYISNNRGKVTFPTPINENIIISKAGYITKTIVSSQIGDTAVVYIQKDSGNKPIINSVYIGNTDLYTRIYETDIIDQNSIVLTADINWRGSSRKKIMLVQDNYGIEFSGDTLTVVLSSKFDVTEPIYIFAETQDGKVTKKKLNIRANTIAVDGLKLNFGDGMAGTIPDSVPLFSGGQVKLDLPASIFPIEYAIEDGKVYVAIGIDLINYSYDDKNVGNGRPGRKSKTKYLVDNLKQDWRDAQKSVNALKNINKKYQNALKKSPAKFGFDASYSCVGFIEGYIDSQGKIQILDSGLIPVIEGKAEWSGQFALGYVPMYWEAYIKAKIEAQLNIYINDSIKNYTPVGTFEGTGTLGGGAGVGINKLLSVGGGIEGSLKPKYEMYSNSDRENSFILNANIGAYFVAKAAFFEYKHVWPSEDYIWYQHPEALYGLNSLTENEQDPFSDLYNVDNYTLQSRDYLNAPSDFVANDDNESNEMTLLSATPANKTTATIKTNVFPQSSPQLVKMADNEQLLVWLDDDPERNDYNRTSLLYSYFDGSIWSDPQTVDDDGTADFSPRLKNINGTPYLVWQNAKTAFDETVTLETMSAEMEIAVSKYDAETNTFAAVTNLTDDSLIDMLPKISGDGSEICAVWVKNLGNDIFGVNGQNNIMLSTFDGIEWSSPTVAYEAVSTVDDLTIGYSAGKRIIAYTLDKDEDINTVYDKELYIDGSEITTNDVLDSKPNFSADKLFWYSGGQINYIDDFTSNDIESILPEGQVMPNDRFEVLSNENGDSCIVFEQSYGVKSELYSFLYDQTADRWSNMIQLSQLDRKIDGFSGFLEESGVIRCAFNNVAVVDVTGSNEPYGQADLTTFEVSPAYNLSVDEIFFSADKLVAGNDLELKFDVTNNGELTVDDLTVRIRDGVGNAISTTEMAMQLMPGETKECTAIYRVPEDFLSAEINVEVTPKGQDDFDMTDNLQTVVLNYIDVAVEDIYCGENADGTKTIYAQIVNRSLAPVSDVVVSLVENTPEGTVLETIPIGSLDTLDADMVTFAQTVIENKVFYVTVYPVENETMVGNNNGFVAIEVVDLATAISNATDLLSNTNIGFGGGNVSQSSHDDYQAAIASAVIVQNNASATQAEVGAALHDLEAGTIIFKDSIIPILLQSIAITTPAAKLSYAIGEMLDITGLVVTGTYSDTSTQIEIITADDITGFESSAPAISQRLTITKGGKTTAYSVQIVAFDYTYSLTEDNAQITGYIGAGGNITIPSILGGYSVLSIGESAFANCDSLTAVTIPGGVTEIGNSAFSGCSNLTAVTIPSSVLVIGSDVFTDTTNLTIYGADNSHAQSYAIVEGIPFKINPTGVISSFIMDRDGQKIIVPLGGVNGYAFAYSTQNELYQYLKGSRAYPVVHGIQSGDKYMLMGGLGGYAMNFSLYPTPLNAMENTAGVLSGTLQTYFIFGGFDAQDNAILTPWSD